MTNKINDGGAAFPRPAVRHQTVEGIYCDSGQQGMTLRDYFAAQLLPAMYYGPESHNKHEHVEVAKRAYQYADAMLKAREEQS